MVIGDWYGLFMGFQMVRCWRCRHFCLCRWEGGVVQCPTISMLGFYRPPSIEPWNTSLLEAQFGSLKKVESKKNPIIGPDNPTCSQFPPDTEFRLNAKCRKGIWRNNGKDKGKGEDVVKERVGKGIWKCLPCILSVLLVMLEWVSNTIWKAGCTWGTSL